jgi:hypothetical protein
MQLRNARLCLDCEEVHEAQQCPACASESFAFITRWVPVPERRARPRPTEPEDPETLDTYRELLAPEGTTTSRRWKVVRGSAVGLAAFGIAGWLWRRTARERTASPDGKDRPASG